MKLLLATPYYWAQSSFNHNLSMLTEIEPLRQAGHQVTLQPLIGDAVNRQRNILAAAARAMDCEALVFVDVDTGFRGDDLVRMLDAGLPVVVANYPKRDYFFDAGMNGEFVDANDVRDALLRGTIAAMPNPRTQAGMIEVWYGGTGLMVIRREVLEGIVARGLVAKVDYPCPRNWRPYCHRFFEFKMTGPDHMLGPNHDLGEDWNFCDLARAAGYSVWCDPRAEASHAGWHCFHGKPRWPQPLETKAPPQPKEIHHAEEVPQCQPV